MIESVELPHLSSLSDDVVSLIRDLSLRENISLPLNFEKESPLILLCGKLAQNAMRAVNSDIRKMTQNMLI